MLLIYNPNGAPTLKSGGSYLKYTQLDLLYYIICPNLNKITWYSNKYINFIIFKIALNILIRGLHHTKEDKNLMFKLYLLCNNNLIDINELTWDEYNLLLKIDSIYNLLHSKNYISFGIPPP